LFEYADWQVALGMHPEVPPSLLRTPFTLIYGWLGVRGFLWHRDRDKRSWWVLTVLFVCGTLGIVAYLNMKTSPSYGFGVLPLDALHEARERDYFFVLGFIAWGLWAGAGAVQTFASYNPRWSAAGILVAVVPFALNFQATDRAHGAESTAALDSARRILAPAPAHAVILAYGDNDTYPVWYAQQVEELRRDVTLVTIPLLGADWYRAELARRHQLLEPRFVDVWRGLEPTMHAICSAAVRIGRPVVATQVPEIPPIPISCKGKPTEKTR
ncbi:MAG: hypothetical protein ABIS03_00580, partial [Gemmatimonadaceae bacterium]